MQVSTFCQTLNPHQSGEQRALECTVKSSVPMPANPFSLPPPPGFATVLPSACSPTASGARPQSGLAANESEEKKHPNQRKQTRSNEMSKLPTSLMCNYCGTETQQRPVKWLDGLTFGEHESAKVMFMALIKVITAQV